jgi:hypothetical protein
MHNLFNVWSLKRNECACLRCIQGERTSIGKNVCVCLLGGHVTSLFFLDKTYINFSEVSNLHEKYCNEYDNNHSDDNDTTIATTTTTSATTTKSTINATSVVVVTPCKYRQFYSRSQINVASIFRVTVCKVYVCIYHGCGGPRYRFWMGGRLTSLNLSTSFLVPFRNTFRRILRSQQLPIPSHIMFGKATEQSTLYNIINHFLNYVTIHNIFRWNSFFQ